MSKHAKNDPEFVRQSCDKYLNFTPRIMDYPEDLLTFEQVVLREQRNFVSVAQKISPANFDVEKYGWIPLSRLSFRAARPGDIDFFALPKTTYDHLFSLGKEETGQLVRLTSESLGEALPDDLCLVCCYSSFQNFGKIQKIHSLNEECLLPPNIWSMFDAPWEYVPVIDSHMQLRFLHDQSDRWWNYKDGVADLGIRALLDRHHRCINRQPHIRLGTWA